MQSWEVAVTAAQPAFFTTDGSGAGSVLALNEDEMLNGPQNRALAPRLDCDRLCQWDLCDVAAERGGSCGTIDRSKACDSASRRRRSVAADRGGDSLYWTIARLAYERHPHEPAAAGVVSGKHEFPSIGEADPFQ